MEATGWFRSRPRVRWGGDGRVIADVDWHRPAALALLRNTRTVYLVSDRGVKMPPVYQLEQIESGGGGRFPLIVGVSSVGDAASPEVRAGVEIVALLAQAGLTGEVRRIDVSDPASIELTSASRGTVIRWGAAPGVVRPGELDAAGKIQNLVAVREAHGAIDAGQDRPIDVSGADVEIDALPR